MSAEDNDWFSPHASGGAASAAAKAQAPAPPKPPAAARPAAPTMNKLPARPASTLPGMTATASPAPAAASVPARATMPGHEQVAAPPPRPPQAASTQLGHAATIMATPPAAPATAAKEAPAPAPVTKPAAASAATASAKAPAPVAMAPTPAAPAATALAAVAATPSRPAQNVAAVDVDVSLEQAAPRDKKRRTIAIAAGAAVGVVVALVVGLRGGRHATPVPAAPPAVAVEAPAAPVVAPPTVVAVPAPAPPAAEPVAEAERPAPAPSPAPRIASAPKASKKVQPHPKGRRLMPDADAQRAQRRQPVRKLALASARKEKPAGDREAARAAYERGNSLLFSGDAGGAASAYREAVRLAPTDPVGYRGLGLASEKEGKSSDAINAFVNYLKLSRHAHDREVIARRLARLTHARK
jgi:hypothetical protein